MQILHIPNDCSATGHVLLLVYGGVQPMTGELEPRNCLQLGLQNALRTRSSTSVASVYVFWVWHVSHQHPKY